MIGSGLLYIVTCKDVLLLLMIFRLHILQYSIINILLIGITSKQIKRSNRQVHTGKRTSRVYIITDYIK